MIDSANGEAKTKAREEAYFRKTAQVEIVGQFNDYSYENLKLTFKQVARQELGPKFRARRTEYNSRRNVAKCLIKSEKHDCVHRLLTLAELVRYRRSSGDSGGRLSANTERGESVPSGYNLHEKGKTMLRTILLILLVLFLVGALPAWPYSAHWGYYPTGGVGLLLLVVIILIVADVL